MSHKIANKTTELFESSLGEKIFDSLSEENNRIENIEHDFSDLDQWMDNYLSDVEEKDKSSQPKIKKKSNLLKYVASFAILLGVVTATLSYNTEAFRHQFLNLFMKDHEEYTEIRKIEDEEMYEVNLLPDYMPDNLKLEKYVELDTMSFAEFKAGETSVVFEISDPNVTIAIDTEGLEIIDLKDLNGFYVEEDGFVRIYWSDGNYHFTIVSNLDIDEVLKIAKSVDPKKLKK